MHLFAARGSHHGNVSGSPPADWYPDPSGVGEYRYWNGSAWTPGVAIGGQIMERPMPWPPVRPVGAPNGGPPHPAAPHAPAPVDDDRIELPPRAALYALLGFVAGLASGVGVAIAGAALDVPPIVVLALNVTGLWTGLLGACFYASRRYGTGSITRDFGLRITGPDVGFGILISFGARAAGMLALIPFIAVSERFAETDQGVFDEVGPNVLAFMLLAVITVVGAPMVEELFFRGLLLRSLSSGLGVNGAIATQAVLFGLAHFSPLLGLANVSVITVIAIAGLIFGITAHQRGIGRSIVAHAAFNLVAVIAAAALLF